MPGTGFKPIMKQYRTVYISTITYCFAKITCFMGYSSFYRFTKLPNHLLCNHPVTLLINSG